MYKCLIVLALGFAATLAYAQSGGALARYQIVPDAQGGVWRIDTASGDLMKCRGAEAIQCAKWR